MIDLTLIELDRLAREDGKKYPQKRFLYEDISRGAGPAFYRDSVRAEPANHSAKQIRLSRPDAFYLIWIPLKMICLKRSAASGSLKGKIFCWMKFMFAAALRRN